MKIAVKYPENKVLKNKTRRLLQRNGIDFEKVTLIADINDKSLLMELEGFGNEVIEIKNSETKSGKVKGFEILNRVFLKAIDEKNRSIMLFLRDNITKEDRELLKEVSK